MFKIIGINANQKFLKSRNRWNNPILSVIGVSKRAPSAENLLDINIKPERIKIIDIK